MHYVEVDVSSGPNTDWAVVKMFESIEEPWDVTTESQWGEPCLLLPHDARAV
jgi:hypothetical protein